VREQIKDVKLIIVGKNSPSSYSDRLHRIANPSIIFTGDVPDEELPLYYAACNVYATATLWEGFDLPLAEAQACGKPIVAFDIGPHPEVIHVGTLGRLIKVGDTKAFAEAIMSFITIFPGEKK
jgi:glycosyltransferase involved in cell wall biosynthesis